MAEVTLTDKEEEHPIVIQAREFLAKLEKEEEEEELNRFWDEMERYTEEKRREKEKEETARKRAQEIMDAFVPIQPRGGEEPKPWDDDPQLASDWCKGKLSGAQRTISKSVQNKRGRVGSLLSQEPVFVRIPSTSYFHGWVEDPLLPENSLNKVDDSN